MKRGRSWWSGRAWLVLGTWLVGAATLGSALLVVNLVYQPVALAGGDNVFTLVMAFAERLLVLAVGFVSIRIGRRRLREPEVPAGPECSRDRAGGQVPRS